MHVVIDDRTGFADAAAAVSRHLPTRPTAPVLAGVLMEATADGLILAGTDYDTAIRVQVSADVQTEGRVVVSGRLLAELAKLLPRHTVTIQVEDETMILTCGTSQATLPLLPIEYYPKLPDAPEPYGEINADMLAAAVVRVGAAASSDDAQVQYCAVSMDLPSPGKPLRLYATDRYQMAVAETDFTVYGDAPTAPGRVHVTARMLETATKALAADGGSVVRISASDEHGRLGLATSTRQVVLARSDVQYMRYDRVMSSPMAHEFTAPTDELLAAVKRLSLYRDTPKASVALTDNAMRLTVAGTSGRSDEEIAIDYGGEDIEFGFFVPRLASALQTIGGDLTHVSVPSNPNRPWLLRPCGDDGEPWNHFQHMLMPAMLTSAGVAKAAA